MGLLNNNTEAPPTKITTTILQPNSDSDFSNFVMYPSNQDGRVQQLGILKHCYCEENTMSNSMGPLNNDTKA